MPYVLNTSNEWKVLPRHAFMLTLTVPEALRALLRSHQRAGYAALFEVSSVAIKTLCAKPKFSRADTQRFLGVSHTWVRPLQFRPRIHLTKVSFVHHH